jgi:hypothetical protein
MMLAALSRITSPREETLFQNVLASIALVGKAGSENLKLIKNLLFHRH